MNVYLLISGCLAIALGVIHSILGEVLIFRHLRESEQFSNSGKTKLKERHLRTLWSTWHLVTLLGWGFGAVLVLLSLPESPEKVLKDISLAVSITFLISSAYWLLGTKGKHPAWAVLATIAIMAWWAGNNA